MKISIITVCYNSEKTISETFNSILNQSYKDIEYIVIDGKSTDKTLQLIQEYKEKFKLKKIIFKYISEEDKGIYDAMNKGISIATGEVIGIINSDDWYEDDILKKISEIFMQNQNIEIVYGKANIVEINGKFKYTYSPGKLENLLETMVICHPTVFVKRCVYDKFRFSLKNKIASDYEFLLDNYLNKTRFKEVDLVISNFRLGGESSEYEILGYKEVLNIQKRKNIKGIKKYFSYCKKIILRKIKKEKV